MQKNWFNRSGEVVKKERDVGSEETLNKRNTKELEINLKGSEEEEKTKRDG